jgi:hypothetical protein
MRSMLRAQLRKVDFHGQTLWESPDGEGGQFSNADVALECWIDRTLVKDPL